MLLPGVAFSVPVSNRIPEGGGDAAEILGRQAGRIESMTCSFVQTKHMSLLADELVSHGTMAFEKPGHLRWEYTRPYSYRFVLNGDRVFVGNDDRNSVIETGNSKIFGTIARVMMNTVTGRIEELGADFGVEVSGTSPGRVVTLTPKKREMKQMFKSVRLTLDEKSGTVGHIKLCEKNGDETDIVLSDIKLNIPVDAALFVVP